MVLQVIRHDVVASGIRVELISKNHSLMLTFCSQSLTTTLRLDVQVFANLSQDHFRLFGMDTMISALN